MANAKVAWGFSLLPLVVALLLWGPMPLVAGVVYAVVAVGLWEFFAMTLPRLGAAAKGAAVLGGVALTAVAYAGDLPLLLFALVAAFLLVLVACLFLVPEADAALQVAARVALGYLYVPLLASFLVLLKDAQGPTKVNWLVPLFLVVWINDAGAYFVGRKHGKRKLFERISPKKTVEGAIGGLVSSFAAILAWDAVTRAFRFSDALLAGLVLGVVGPVGDLVESMLKRATGVKDSGNLIPGHGGILDRTDSILLAAPFLYFFVYFRYIRPMI
jgi:phosphatidate cytidylyltransferase